MDSKDQEYVNTVNCALLIGDKYVVGTMPTVQIEMFSENVYKELNYGRS